MVGVWNGNIRADIKRHLFCSPYQRLMLFPFRQCLSLLLCKVTIISDAGGDYNIRQASVRLVVLSSSSIKNNCETIPLSLSCHKCLHRMGVATTSYFISQNLFPVADDLRSFTSRNDNESATTKLSLACLIRIWTLLRHWVNFGA